MILPAQFNHGKIAEMIASTMRHFKRGEASGATPGFLSAHRDPILLCILLAVSFVVKILPLMQYPWVGGDPFVHYEYAMALLNGKLSVPVSTVANGAGTMVELYYPPLFHALSLGLFLAFPGSDPYTTMKILAVIFDSLQIIPLYLIVRRVMHSSAGALFASYVAISVRSDYQMLSWGGYANIAALFFACALIYSVLSDQPILSGTFTLALALTHHLSLLLMAMVLGAYYLFIVARDRAIPRTLAAVAVGAIAAYFFFYRFAMLPILDFYSKYSPVYNQSLYVTPYVLEQVGGLLILSAIFGLVIFHVRKSRLIEGSSLLLLWTIIPVVLAYAYVFGVQWHGVRWIHFIPMPLLVWTGIGVGHRRTGRLLLPLFFVLFTIQLIFTLQGYHSDILRNITEP